jgi:hypothetical protein
MDSNDINSNAGILYGIAYKNINIKEVVSIAINRLMNRIVFFMVFNLKLVLKLLRILLKPGLKMRSPGLSLYGA